MEDYVVILTFPGLADYIDRNLVISEDIETILWKKDERLGAWSIVQALQLINKYKSDKKIIVIDYDKQLAEELTNRCKYITIRPLRVRYLEYKVLVNSNMSIDTWQDIMTDMEYDAQGKKYIIDDSCTLNDLLKSLCQMAHYGGI